MTDHQYGPKGHIVDAFITHIKGMTRDDWGKFYAAWDAARDAAESGPGLIWKVHDGSEECPMDPTDAVMVRYGGGTCVYKVMARLIRDWENVTHYASITPPEGAA